MAANLGSVDDSRMTGLYINHDVTGSCAELKALLAKSHSSGAPSPLPRQSPRAPSAIQVGLLGYLWRLLGDVFTEDGRSLVSSTFVLGSITPGARANTPRPRAYTPVVEGFRTVAIVFSASRMSVSNCHDHTAGGSPRRSVSCPVAAAPNVIELKV